MQRIKMTSIGIKEIASKRKKYNTNPAFQRQSIWRKPMQTALFNTILQELGLPKFYFASKGDGKFVVIDGKQRLEAICAIIDNKVRDSNGRTYSQLTEEEKDIVDTTTIEVEIVTGTPIEIRDLYQRLNSGMPLTLNEKRHAKFDLPEYSIIEKLSEHNVIDIFGIPTKRFKNESWMNQCGSLGWQKVTNTLYKRIGNAYKYAGLEEKKSKEAFDENMSNIFDAIALSMHDDGETVIDISSPAAIEIFFGYMTLYFDYTTNEGNIMWENIDGKDIVEKFLVEREKRSQTNTSYGIACSGAITGEGAIESRMEFVKKFFNDYVVAKYNLKTKEKKSA